MVCEFLIGEQFSTLQELETKIDIYKQEHATELSISDSRKISSAISSGRLSKDKFVNKDLVYFELKYVCVEAGKFRPRGEGKRKSRYIVIIDIIDYFILF